MKVKKYLGLIASCLIGLFCTNSSATLVTIKRMEGEQPCEIILRHASNNSPTTRIEFDLLFGHGLTEAIVQLDQNGWIQDSELTKKVIQVFKRQCSTGYPKRPENAIVCYTDGAFEIHEFITVYSIAGTEPVTILLKDMTNQRLDSEYLCLLNHIFSDSDTFIIAQKIQEEYPGSLLRVHKVFQSVDNFPIYNYLMLPSRQIRVHKHINFLELEAGPDSFDLLRNQTNLNRYSMYFGFNRNTVMIDTGNLPTNEEELMTFLTEIEPSLTYYCIKMDRKPSNGSYELNKHFSRYRPPFRAEDIMKVVALMLDLSETTRRCDEESDQRIYEMIQEIIPQA